ncbi:MAG: hypothetical protein ACFFEN_10875 [Candidatus Thorarchaeota archaeon]
MHIISLISILEPFDLEEFGVWKQWRQMANRIYIEDLEELRM